MNDGNNVATGPFTNRLRIDNQNVHFEITDSLGTSYVTRYDSVVDLSRVLSSGVHACTLFVDVFDDVEEADETDNFFAYEVSVFIPTVNVFGIFQYRDRNFTPSSQNYYRNPLGFRVELWEDNGGQDELLDVAETYYSSGFANYRFNPVPNIDTAGGQQSRRDLYVKLFAANQAGWAFRDTSKADTVFFKTETRSEVDNGPENFFIGIVPMDLSGTFYPLEYIDSARNYWTDLTGMQPDPVAITLSTYSVSGYFKDTVDHYSFIIFDSLAAAEGEELSSFNRWIICHEYGHFLQDTIGFLEPGYPYGHRWTDPKCDSAGLKVPCPTSLITEESFCNLFSCGVLDTNIYRHIFLDSFGTFTWNVSLQLDSGLLRIRYENRDSHYDTLLNNLGSRVEASVSGLLGT